MAKNITFKNMNVENVITDLRNTVSKPEHMLGRSLLQPFCNTNSGSRKLMHSTHLEQRLPLIHPEVPFIQTGYENEFGKYASSFYKANTEYLVLAKIQKFIDNPNHHYFLIIQDCTNGELDIVERKQYEYITESNGYLYNNTYLDRLKPYDETVGYKDHETIISEGDVYKKSMAYDEYNNRRDGVNLLTAYIATAKNTEDSVIISESAAEKLSSPLIKPVTIIINENDILLNMYGSFDNYKSFPDIGEEVDNGLLAVVRREKKEESLFTHSYDRLTSFLINDDKFMVDGKVIDVDIYCNNPETINESLYNIQIKKYNDNKLRYLREVVTVVRDIQNNNGNKLSMTYELQKFLYEANRVLEGAQFINDRPFTGTVVKLTVLEENKIKIGDKVSDRYGGKGVVSYILPDDEMPIIACREQPVDILFNQSTCVGRLNPGQMFETSTTFTGKRLIDYILLEVLDVDESLELVREYMEIVGTQMSEFIEDMLDPNNPEIIKEGYLNSILKDEGIILSLEPITNSMTIDQLAKLYDEFEWAKPYEMIMPIRDSNGRIRYTKSRRPMIIGNKYIYRLKQYAEDKFSVTSHSATNIRNLNTRSKGSKQHKMTHNNTPIRWGEMEIGNYCHMGSEFISCLAMMYSSSPHGRRTVQSLYTGNPFDINIKLDGKAKNRNVEIINARLKTCGYRLTFRKKPKKLVNPVRRLHTNVVTRPRHNVVRRIHTNVVTRPMHSVVKRLDKEEK